MDELEAKITEEIAAITDWLQASLGRPSRWNGEVELSDDADNYGKALWSGHISLGRQIAQNDLRWRTMIHEALHLFSAGLTPMTYLELRGWEEGVVEQLQRLLRRDILYSLQVSVPVDMFLSAEKHHRYNGFVSAFEDMREFLGEPSAEFYLNLLATPLKERPAEMMAASTRLSAEDSITFRRVFALSFSILRRE